jgi:hypothetical protein
MAHLGCRRPRAHEIHDLVVGRVEPALCTALRRVRFDEVVCDLGVLAWVGSMRGVTRAAEGVDPDVRHNLVDGGVDTGKPGQTLVTLGQEDGGGGLSQGIEVDVLGVGVAGFLGVGQRIGDDGVLHLGWEMVPGAGAEGDLIDELARPGVDLSGV